MSKAINIEHVLVKQPIRIEVDGQEYPINQRNIQAVNMYWESGDEAELDRLTEISLVF